MACCGVGEVVAGEGAREVVVGEGVGTANCITDHLANIMCTLVGAILLQLLLLVLGSLFAHWGGVCGCVVHVQRWWWWVGVCQCVCPLARARACVSVSVSLCVCAKEPDFVGTDL